MNRYVRKLEEIEKERQGEESRLMDHLASLGDLLVLSKTAFKEDSPLAQMKEKVSAIHEEIPDLLSRRDRFLEVKERLEEARQKISALDKEDKRLGKEKEPYWDDFGRAVYELHRRGVLVGEGLSAELNLLEQKESEIQQIDNDIIRSQKNESGNIFNKVVESSRKAVLGTSRAGKMSSLNRHLKALGEKAAAGGVLEKVADAGYSDAARPLLEIRGREETLQTQREEAAAREQKLSRELHDLGLGGTPSRTIRELARQIDVTTAEYRRQCACLAENYLESLGEEETRESGLRKTVDDIRACQKRILALEKLEERVQAGKEALSLSADMDVLRKRIEKLTKEREEISRLISETETAFADKEKSFKKKEKLRGAEENLGLE